jgi:hypothetical protein
MVMTLFVLMCGDTTVDTFEKMSEARLRGTLEAFMCENTLAIHDTENNLVYNLDNDTQEFKVFVPQAKNRISPVEIDTTDCPPLP